MAEDKKSTKGTKVITERSIAFGSTGTQNTSNTGKSNSDDSGNKSSTKDSNDGQSKKK